MLVLENDRLRVEVDPQQGGEIAFVGAPGGPNALASYDWDTPVAAEAGSGYGASHLDWLSRYRGRWQELFPNAGDPCEVHGAPLGFHGEASLTPWRVLGAMRDRCELEVPTRLPLVLTRRMTLARDRPVLLIEETVRNESDLEVPFLWGHHPAFPAVPGARIELPPCELRAEPVLPGGFGDQPGAWPSLADADGTPQRVDVVPAEPVQRLLYATGLQHGWAALRQAGGLPGVALSWDVETFPAMWLWLQNGTEEFPWFGRARLLTLEPQTTQPFDGLAAAHARGEAHVLPPRGTRHSWLTLALLPDDPGPIARVERDGSVYLDTTRETDA